MKFGSAVVVLLTLLPLGLTYSSYYPMDGIRIGLISDQNVEQMTTIFERSIAAANVELEIPLRSTQAEVSYGNSYEAYDTLCEMLMTGVGGVFGPSAKSTALHLMNICDSKEIPYIFSHMNFDPGKTVINLHPRPQDIAQVIHDLVDAYAWTSFTFLYESADFLVILNELMELYALNGPLITVRRYDLQLGDNYRSVLRRVRKSADNKIVIVGSTESLPEVLLQIAGIVCDPKIVILYIPQRAGHSKWYAQLFHLPQVIIGTPAQQVGIITEDYKYIIGSLDLQTIDLEQFKHSEANITGIRMFSPEQPEVKDLIISLGYPEDDIERNITCPVTMEMALLYDAVQLYAETTKSLKFRPVPLNCSEESVWDRGYTFGNYLALSVAQGLTGKIFFEGGVRSDYNLEIVELTASGLAKVGNWHTEEGLTISRYTPTSSIMETDELSLINKTFTVLLAMNAPYAMLKKSTVKLNGNNRYEGFGIDLIQHLAEKLGFNYTFNMHVDDNYGFYNATSNTSTGMVHEIMEGRADLGVTDLTITSEREAGVDFTIPFMNLGISILYRKPRKAPPALLSFMDPFSGEVWLYLGLSYLGVSLSLFILGRISPAEWDCPYPCIEEPTELQNQFSMGNAIWFATGSLLQQGSEIAPKAPSTRTVASIWWFFTLIIVSSYTANLAAFLTIEMPTSTIDNVNDLAKGGVNYGAKSKGSTRNFFQFSDDETYHKMNEFMTLNPTYLTSTNDEGVQRVLNEDYAFLMESTSIEYNVARLCNLTQIGGLLDEKGYGIAMRKNWPYRDKINGALLELQESGGLTRMKSKWWNEVGTGGCTSKSDQSEAAELGMPNLGGVYVVLLVGSSLAAACGIVDWVFFVYRKARHFNVPFMDAIKEELQIVTDFSNNTRIVHTTGSVYSRNSSLVLESIEESEHNNED